MQNTIRPDAVVVPPMPINLASKVKFTSNLVVDPTLDDDGKVVAGPLFRGIDPDYPTKFHPLIQGNTSSAYSNAQRGCLEIVSKMKGLLTTDFSTTEKTTQVAIVSVDALTELWDVTLRTASAVSKAMYTDFVNVSYPDSFGKSAWSLRSSTNGAKGRKWVLAAIDEARKSWIEPLSGQQYDLPFYLLESSAAFVEDTFDRNPCEAGTCRHAGPESCVQAAAERKVGPMHLIRDWNDVVVSRTGREVVSNTYSSVNCLAWDRPSGWLPLFSSENFTDPGVVVNEHIYVFVNAVINNVEVLLNQLVELDQLTLTKSYLTRSFDLYVPVFRGLLQVFNDLTILSHILLSFRTCVTVRTFVADDGDYLTAKSFDFTGPTLNEVILAALYESSTNDIDSSVFEKATECVYPRNARCIVSSTIFMVQDWNKNFGVKDSVTDADIAEVKFDELNEYVNELDRQCQSAADSNAMSDVERFRDNLATQFEKPVFN